MDLVVVGLNHQTAPVALREKVAFSRETLPGALARLVASPDVAEAMILSTCNRVEVYGVCPQAARGIGSIQDFLRQASQNHGPTPHVDLVPYLYAYQDEAAIRHVFRVAASLDSMILGETQISGQIKEAYQCALESHTCGRLLNQLMHRTFGVAKRVRHETKIGAESVSAGSVAVDLVAKVFDQIASRRVLIVGFGDMGREILLALHAHGVERVDVVNRSQPAQAELAGLLINQFFDLDSINEAAAQADIVIVALGSPRVGSPSCLHAPVLWQNLVKTRQYSPLVIVDISVPRSVPDAVGKLDNVYLFNVDDLQDICEQNRRTRASHALFAETIVEKEASSFAKTLLNPISRPTIKELAQKSEALRAREVAKTLSKFPLWEEKERLALERCTQAIVNGLLREPIVTLKSELDGEDSLNYLELVRRLFKLEE